MSGLDALAEALGAPPPGDLADALTDAELAALAAAVRDERARQSAALAAATEAAFAHVPRLLRAPIRKLVIG